MKQILQHRNNCKEEKFKYYISNPKKRWKSKVKKIQPSIFLKNNCLKMEIIKKEERKEIKVNQRLSSKYLKNIIKMKIKRFFKRDFTNLTLILQPILFSARLIILQIQPFISINLVVLGILLRRKKSKWL